MAVLKTVAGLSLVLGVMFLNMGCGNGDTVSGASDQAAALAKSGKPTEPTEEQKAIRAKGVGGRSMGGSSRAIAPAPPPPSGGSASPSAPPPATSGN